MSQRDPTPTRDHMMPESFYRSLDAGIRFPVRVLHAAGLETCQSCEGGQGHAYDHPTIDCLARAEDARGFVALSALTDYGCAVVTVSLVWNVRHGLPYEKLWRIVLEHAHPARANEQPLFVYAYRATR